MVARLEKTAQGYVVPLSDEMVHAMRLSEGASVEIHPVVEDSNQSHRGIRYATVDEALRAFEATLPRHEAAYRELAK